MLALLLVGASGLSLEVERLSVDRGHATAIVKVVNSGPSSYQAIFVECAFLDAGKKALGVGLALLSNLPSGETAYGDVKELNVPDTESVRCRISRASP